MSRKALTYDFSSQLGRDVASDDLVSLMQEEDEFAEQRQILEEMKPKLREKFEQIRELVESEIHAVLRNRYALGEHFQALYDDETDNGAKVYGKHAVQNICRLLGIDKTLVNNCMRFVQVYSRADLDMLCTRLLPRNEHLSWSHVRCLVQEDDDKRREQLLEKTFNEGLTCSELDYAIRCGNDHESNKGGRPLKIPASFDGMVQQQKKFAEEWERRSQKVWSHPTHSLVVKAAELAEEEVTEERLKEAAELAYQLRVVADEANRAADKAEAVVHNFERILAERKASAGSPAKSVPRRLLRS